MLLAACLYLYAPKHRPDVHRLSKAFTHLTACLFYLIPKSVPAICQKHEEDSANVAAVRRWMQIRSIEQIGESIECQFHVSGDHVFLDLETVFLPPSGPLNGHNCRLTSLETADQQLQAAVSVIVSDKFRRYALFWTHVQSWQVVARCLSWLSRSWAGLALAWAKSWGMSREFGSKEWADWGHITGITCNTS